MSVLLSVVSGWTGRLGAFTLKADGTPLVLTGLTVTIVIHKPDGTLVTPGGTLTVDPDQTANPGKVYYSPGTADFVWADPPGTERQPYRIHFKVVDSDSKVVYFPNGAADEISVYRA